MTLFSNQLDKKGRFPPITIEITPYGGGKTITFNDFISYQFSSSMVVPVDSFSFSFSAPSDPRAFNSYVREGDLIQLYANNVLAATGIVDQIEIEVDGESGEKATINGRDLMGSLEDNMAITIESEPIWPQEITIVGGAQRLIVGTRIQQVIDIDAPTTPVPFATAPEESRLSALMRLIEPFNCLAWCSPQGHLTVGRPDFASVEKGSLICNKQRRFSNVFNMRTTHSAASIANTIVVLWTDVQNTQLGIASNQIYQNNANGPLRLLRSGHNVIRTVVTSMPQGASAQDQRDAAEYKISPAADTLLQALAKRELARQNFNELIVQCSVPGHFNENGEMYRADTCYIVDFDRANINEKMYCYAVEWNLSPERGQYTILSLCRLGTIVSDVEVL